MDANCTMNNEIVPKSIDGLRRVQNVSAQHKQITNMQNMQNTQTMPKYLYTGTSILGRLPLVPVGATGTIPFAMCRDTADFPRAFCDKSANGGDGCRWWNVNSWALGWGTKQ